MAATDRLESLRALRTANLDLAFATMFAALVAGNFQQAFALELNASPRMLAFLAALPAILGVLQIPGSVLGDRFRSYKWFVSFGGFFWRFAWVPVVFLPILPAAMPRLEILIGCIIFSAAANYLVASTYGAWLSYLVPESHRGWYFSRRIAIATVVSVLISLPASFALDWMTRADDFTVGLTLIFGTGVVLGWVSFGFYLKMPNTLREGDSAPLSSSIKSLWTPLRDKQFVGLLVFLIAFVFAQAFAGPFFFPYGRQVLHLDFVTFQIFAAFHAGATLFSAKMWGYLSDKYGNKPVLFISGLILCLGPFSWALCNSSLGVWNYVILAVGHMAAGFSWTGVAVAQGNIILANTAPELRAQGLALSQTVIAVVGFGSQMVAGEFMQRTIGMMSDEQRYQTLFIVNGGLRIGAILLLYFVKDATSSSLRGFLRQVARIRPKGVIAMRQLSSAGDVAEKARAIRALGTSGMAMAETELSSLLMDPSPRIRREAAEALQLVGGDEAVLALSKLIQNHPHLAEEEMVEAIAAIGSGSAVPALVSLLENPSSALRRASAKAMGRLRSPAAVSALKTAATNQDDAELRRAAIQAMRLIGDPSCAPVIESALRDSYPSVRIAAAEAIAELELSECAPLLRRILSARVDETSAELVYALATVGEESDAQLALSVCAQMRTGVTRRRCLLAASKLYGVEEKLYRLLMLDSVGRDQALIEFSDDRAYRRALSLYHRGEEGAALDGLAKRTNDPRIGHIATRGIREGFLLAACLLA